MKTIPLTQGKVALVDDEDFEELSKFKWCAKKTRCGYMAVRGSYCPSTQKIRTIYMHRLIVDCPQGKDVDHANHNTLDNRKSNLRICTRSQNNQNRLSHKNSSSQHKGVSWHKQKRKWRADIRVNGRLIHLGLFDSEIEAAKAYDETAKKYFGEFARLNFPKKKAG